MSAKKFEKHELNFEKTVPYFSSHIKCGKTLSKKVVQQIDFRKGAFFTCLPSNANIERIYDFSFGGILPVVSCDSGHAFTQKVDAVDKECGDMVLSYLKNHSESVLNVENYMLEPCSIYVPIEGVRDVSFLNEVYYFLNSRNSNEEICETIRKSSEVWHFLALITEMGNLEILTDQIMDDVCNNAKLVIASAYDGEGYIFWERKHGYF